jgi:hypothetical protein
LFEERLAELLAELDMCDLRSEIGSAYPEEEAEVLDLFLASIEKVADILVLNQGDRVAIQDFKSLQMI